MIRVSILLCLILLCGCATAQQASMPCTPPPMGSAWYNQPLIYGLRHDGVLQIGGKTIPMTGFMKLDIPNRRATVSLLTGLGIKLATMEISATDYRLIETSPLAERIPLFAQQCALTIRRAFFTDFPVMTEYCFQKNEIFTLTERRHEGTMRTTVDRDGHILEKRLKSPAENWTISYQGMRLMETIRLPEKITFASADKPYTVILQLTGAKRQ